MRAGIIKVRDVARSSRADEDPRQQPLLVLCVDDSCHFRITDLMGQTGVESPEVV